MNNPLDYLGYRVFQSSYFRDGRGAEGSVFTRGPQSRNW